MKRFKKFFRYFGVFVLLAVAVAGFKVANFLLGQKPQEELSEPSGKEESSALTEILDKLMNMQTGEFDLTIGIEADKDVMSLQAKALVDMGTNETKANELKALPTGGMKVALDGSFALNGQEIEYKISYLEDFIFANVSGFDVKMLTSNLEQDITTLLSLSMFERFGLEFELPELSMDNFDNSLLVKLTSSIKEEKTEGQIKVSLNLFGYGDVVVLTDEEYNPKQIIIEELNFDGTKISCLIDTKLNENIGAIEKPQNADQMVDLTNLTHIASAVSELLDKGYISGNVDFVAYGQNFNAKYEINFADFKNPNLYAETMIAGQKLVLSYENKKVFVSYDGLKYYLEIDKFDFAEILEKVENLSLTFGYVLPKLELPQNFELSQITGLLTVVDNFVLEKDYISLSLLGATFDVEIVDGEFDNFKFAYGDDVVATMNLNEEIEKENIDKSQYFSIDNLQNKISSIISQIREKKFAANVVLNASGIDFKTTIFVDFAKDLKLRVCGEREDFSYDIVCIDEYIFVNVNGLKIKYELPNLNIDAVLEEVENILAQYLPEFELPSFEDVSIENIFENINFSSLSDVVNNIDFEIVSANEDFVEISVEGFAFKIYGDELIEDVSFEYQDFAFSAELLDNNFEIATTDDYVKINVALGYIPAIIDFVSAGKYQLATTISLGDIKANVVGKIDITNGLKSQFEVEIDEFVFEITYLDEVVYINFSNKTFKATLKELQELFERFETENEVEENNNSNFDVLEDIIGDENVLEIALKAGLSIILEKDGNNLTGLCLVYEDMSLALDLSSFDGEITYVENEQVLNIVELYDFVDVLANFVANETLAFDIEFEVADFVVVGKAMVKNNDITAYFETEILDRILLVVLKDNRIYLDFDGLRITCAIDQIEDLVAYVAEYIGAEMPAIGLPQEIDIEKLIADIVLKLEDEVLSISFEDLILSIDTTEEKFNSIFATYGDISLTLVPCEEFEKEIVGNYIELYELKDLSRAVYNTLKNMSVSGTIEVTLNLFGEDNLLSIDYAIALKGNKVIGFVETEFKGLAINAYIDGEDIYLSVVGLKIHLNLNNLEEFIDWVNETFEANIDTEAMNKTFEDLKNMKLDFISSVTTVDGTTYVSFTTGMKIEVQYDEYVNVVRFEQDGREAILTCTDFSLINLNKLVKEEYRDYTAFTPLIENVYNLALSNQYDLSGVAKVYKNNALSMDISGDIQLDITNGLLAYVDINGLGEQITINYQDKKLYLCYAGADGLKISIGEEAIQEIAAILLSAMGVDVSSIPFLNDILTKEDINTDNLGSLIPDVELGNPLNYLEYIDSFEMTDEYFAINIKGEKISSFAKGQAVSIKLYYSGKKVTALQVSNLYISENERFDLNITLNEFGSVTKVVEEDKANYIDLTNSKDLIRAFANTSVLNDYHINGKVKLNVDIGIEFPMAALNVDARIKRDEIERTYVDETTGEIIYEKTNEITAIITIDNYPLIGFVNNSNTNGVGGLGGLINIRARKITIVLKGGYAYLFTDDESWGAYSRLQRATKVTTAYLLNNIEYYMQYLLGFTDTIQTKINETFEAMRNYNGPVKYGDIIKQYTMSGRKHTIVLNMAEIAHNGDIGNLTINLTTLNDASTGNKDFLYRLDLTMELFGGMLSISTNQNNSTEALFLVNIGNAVDLSTCNKMTTDYDFTYNLGVDGEYEKQGSNAWKQANTGSSTVTFMNLGQVYAETTGAIASPMTLPTLTRVEYETRDDGEYKVEYKFLGWFTDENCTQKFETLYFPRYNTILFAGWEVSSEKKKVNVSFVTGEESKTEAPLVGYATEKLTLPASYSSIETKVNENVSILKTFLGWFDENGVEYTNANFNKFPESDMTLYGKWLVEETSTYYLTIEYDGNVYNTTVPGEREYDFAIVKDIYKAGTSKAYDFETGKEVTSFVINTNAHWVIKNPFVATVRSYFNTNGNIDASKTYEVKIGENPVVYNGDTIELQVQQNYTDDLGTYIVEYVFNGYKAIRLDTDGEDSSLGELIAPNANGKIETTMPSRNVVYVADWTATEYVYVTFDTTWAKPSSWVDKNDIFKGKVERLSVPTPVSTIKVQRNVAFDPSKYNSTCKYKYTVVLVPGTYNFFVGTWKTEGGTSCAFSTTPVDASKYSVLTSITPSEHMTLYAHWDA